MVGLCSKTYFGWGDKNKCSTKRISKSHNQLDKETFLNVLVKKQSAGGINMGFQVRNNAVYTYQQQRNALSYLYPKRKVMEDGVTAMVVSKQTWPPIEKLLVLAIYDHKHTKQYFLVNLQVMSFQMIPNMWYLMDQKMAKIELKSAPVKLDIFKTNMAAN